MKKFYVLLFSFLCVSAFGQRRFLDAQFEVSMEPGVTYANNIGVLTGAPVLETLKMDIYSPVGDADTDRPVILVSHTGIFLPPVINGQATGSRTDGTVVYICQQLAARGYVAVAYSYRLGWNPVSDDPNVRTSTLLQAAYRGIQDTRACVRFFRKSADTDGNPYGIDPNKIGALGIGAGGYLALGAGSIYSYDEVTLDKFIDTETALPYINEAIHGNVFGDVDAAINVANHAGYNSEIAFSFNIGGAMGDNSWIDGDEQEAAFAGVHATNDIFAPYSEGPVIVPTTNEFVVNVAGTRAAIQYANERGNNDVFADLDAANDPLRAQIEVQKEADLTLYTGQTLKMGTDNFYAFATPFPQGSPWDWWNYDVLAATVAFLNANLGTEYNADVIHQQGLATNPDMSPEKGKIYCDSTLMLMLPRACLAMNLGCEFSSTEDIIDAGTIGLSIAPNPIVESATVKTSSDFPINSIYMYDMSGKLVKAVTKLDTNAYTLERNNLNSGIYFVNVRTEKGTVVQKIIME
jgi:hypothetical protein